MAHRAAGRRCCRWYRSEVSLTRLAARATGGGGYHTEEEAPATGGGPPSAPGAAVLRPRARLPSRQSHRCYSRTEALQCRSQQRLEREQRDPLRVEYLQRRAAVQTRVAAQDAAGAGVWAVLETSRPVDPDPGVQNAQLRAPLGCRIARSTPCR
jgi:hypothetical protein